MIDAKELALAREHPRATERKRLAPYRAALNDVSAYAALPESHRDAIVRWAEIRRRLKEDFGIDRDPANLADPLIAADALRAHVLAGERRAHEGGDDGGRGGDVVAAVAAIRASAPPRAPTRSSRTR